MDYVTVTDRIFFESVGNFSVFYKLFDWHVDDCKISAEIEWHVQIIESHIVRRRNFERSDLRGTSGKEQFR